MGRDEAPMGREDVPACEGDAPTGRDDAPVCKHNAPIGATREKPVR